MTITNHAAMGALVAAAINKPWLSLPAALASHFMVDTIPHWDYELKGGHKTRQLAAMIDFTLALFLLLILALTVDASRSLIIAGGILAILPDAMWAAYRNVEFPKSFPRNTLIGRFRGWHQKIQWSETSWGKYVEIGWLVLVLILIYQL